MYYNLWIVGPLEQFFFNFALHTLKSMKKSKFFENFTLFSSTILPPPFAAKSLAKFVGFFQILGELRFPYLCLVGFVGKQEIYTERRALHRRSHNREKRIQSRSNQKTTQKILTAMKGNPNITISELSKICEITVDGVKWQLKSLTKSGHISRIGGDRGGHWEVLE